jgi:ATP-binding cassette subfamily B protein/subfamily B ATP-binding cassette protein MsbA
MGMKRRQVGDQTPGAPARRLILAVVRRHWGALVSAGGSTIVLTLADLAAPWPLKWVIDGVIGRHSMPFDLSPAETRRLVLIAGAVVGIAVADALATYSSELLLKRSGERITHDLRVAMYGHLQRLSLAFHDRRQKGDLVTRLTEDANEVGTLFSESIGTMAQAVLTLIGMAAVTVLVDPVLGVVMFVIAPVLGVVTTHYRRGVRLAARQQRRRESEIASLAAETLSAMRVVKASGSEHYEEARVTDRSEARRRFGVQAAGLEARFGGAVDVLGAVGMAVVLVVGASRVASSAITTGELIVVATYARRMYRPLSDLAKQTTKAARSMARAERVAEVLAADEVLEDRPDAFSTGQARGAVELRDVTFAYEPGRPVLEGLSLRIPAGSRVAFVGASGAGKSTVGALIARFYDPVHGRVLIDGRDARDCSLAWMRDQVALVLQDTVLFSGTVAENIAYGTQAAREDVIRAATTADADRFISGLPDGYDGMLGPQGVGLSGGQRQRLGIARALLRDPPILVLDEPTTGLDAASEAQVMEGLGALMRGRTTILITHSIALARAADRVVVLDAGRIVQNGSPKELLAAAGPFRGLAAEQGLMPRRRRPVPPADRAVPALRMLLDPDASAPLLQSTIGEGGQIQEVVICRVRYRPSKDLVVLYDAIVRGRSHGVVITSGTRRSLPEVAADPGALAAARSVDGRSPAATPLAYDSRTDALVQWLPLDLALPLVRAGSDDVRLGLAGLGLDSTACGEPELVSYAPGRRATVVAGDYVLKGYPGGDALWRALRGWEAAGPGAPVAGRLEGALLGLGATVVAGRGTTAAAGLSGAGEAGALLRELHDMQGRSLASMTAADTLRSTLRSAAVLRAIVPVAADRIDRLAERLAASTPATAAGVTAHGDFEARELVHRDGALAVADLGRACVAAPALDLSSYAADAAAREGGGAAQALAVLDALLEGYRGRPAALRWHLSAALLRKAERPFRALEEAWPVQVERAVDAAGAVLSD